MVESSDHMSFFSRFLRRSAPASRVDGLLGYYGLGEWWLSTFSEAERQHIEARYQPMGAPPASRLLTRGPISSTSQTAVEFLSGLAGWFRTVDDASLALRIRAKMDELSQSHPGVGPGFYQGRHFTTCVEEVKTLKRTGDAEGAERLLLALVDATEDESRAKGRGWGVAPWYYQELAKLYHARKDYAAEVAILERYVGQEQAPGASPAELFLRLERARALLTDQQEHDR
jgi:hypothetical protein